MALALLPPRNNWLWLEKSLHFIKVNTKVRNNLDLTSVLNRIQAYTFKISFIGVPVAIVNIDRAWPRSAHNDVLDIPPREVST